MIVVICWWIGLQRDFGWIYEWLVRVERQIALWYHANSCRLKRRKLVRVHSWGWFLEAKLIAWLRLVKVLFNWIWRRHKITKWWGLISILLFNHHRRLICFIDFLVYHNLLLDFGLHYFVSFYIQTFLDDCLGSFLACFDSKCCERLIMLATWLRLIITLGTTIPSRIVENYLSLLIKAFDFAKLNFPLLRWNHWEITLTSIRKIKNELPFVYANIKLGLLSVFTQVRVPNIKRSKFKPWGSLNHRVILCVKVYRTTK